MLEHKHTTSNLPAAILPALLCLAFLPVASGCASLPDPVNEVFVVANVAGSHVDTSSAEGELDRSVDANSFVGIVNADGNPGLVGSAGVVGSTSTSTSRKNQENEAWRAQLEQALASVVPDDPECDLLASIDCARRCFNEESAYADATNTIVVFSNGLSTAGVLDMRSGLLFADPSDVVSFYRDELPDLSGIDVEWYGLGNTCEPQATPTNATKAVMEQFWASVLVDGCGADAVNFHDVNAAAEPQANVDRPTMSTVELPKAQVMEASAITQGTSVTLDSQTLYFKPDLAEFVDREQAIEALRPYAEAMNEDASLTVSIVGSTASDHDVAYLSRLSNDRALATAELFEAMGIDPSRISCEGVGNWGADHIYDWADAGETELEPVAAAANRHVTLSFS